LGVQHHLYPSKSFFIFNNRFDQYDRKIIGWTLSDGMSAEQTSLAWSMAIKTEVLKRF
jgi:hypothetical protein